MLRGASAKQRLDFLDAARGLAAMLVLIEHGLEGCAPDLLRSSLGRGNLGRAGVILFLLISGFIIPASLEQGGSNARFWLRRFFRLFPAYWLSIGLAYGFCWGSGQFVTSLRIGDWFLNLTMLQGFFGRTHALGVFWTLQLELVIYATCSLLFAVRLLGRSSTIAGLVLTGYALLGLARPLLAGQAFALNGPRFLYLAPLTGLLAQRSFAGRFGRGALLAFVLCQICILAAVWSVNHALFPTQITTACLWEMACTWGVAYVCFFLLLAVRHRPMPATGCWLGRISYSVYLLHPLALVAVEMLRWPAWAFLASLLIGTLMLAELAYRYVELPGIALGRALEKRWWPARAQTNSNGQLLRRAA